MPYTFTDPSPVVVGAATKKSFWDKVYENTFWLRDNTQRCLWRSTTPVANVGAGADVLMSYTLPADTLVNGMEIEMFGQTAGNANSKTLALWIGGTGFVMPAAAMNLSSWRFRAVVVRAPSSPTIFTCTFVEASLTTDAVVRTLEDTSSAAVDNWSVDKDIQVTGEGVANNDILLNGGLIKIF